jgi:hypothetical protein
VAIKIFYRLHQALSVWCHQRLACRDVARPSLSSGALIFIYAGLAIT